MLLDYRLVVMWYSILVCRLCTLNTTQCHRGTGATFNGTHINATTFQSLSKSTQCCKYNMKEPNSKYPVGISHWLLDLKSATVEVQVQSDGGFPFKTNKGWYPRGLNQNSMECSNQWVKASRVELWLLYSFVLDFDLILFTTMICLQPKSASLRPCWTFSSMTCVVGEIQWSKADDHYSRCHVLIWLIRRQLFLTFQSTSFFFVFIACIFITMEV